MTNGFSRSVSVRSFISCVCKVFLSLSGITTRQKQRRLFFLPLNENRFYPSALWYRSVQTPNVNLFDSRCYIRHTNTPLLNEMKWASIYSTYQQQLQRVKAISRRPKSYSWTTQNSDASSSSKHIESTPPNGLFWQHISHVFILKKWKTLFWEANVTDSFFLSLWRLPAAMYKAVSMTK